MKVSIQKTNELLELRQQLNAISQISWNVNVLNKRYPIDYLEEEQADELIQSYRRMLGEIKNLVKNENEYSNTR